MAIKFLSSENIAGDIDVTLSKNGITYLAVTNTNTGASANARVQVVGESAQIDIIATSVGYTGVSGWADSGVISTDSAASGGLILNSVAGIVKLQTSQTTALTIDNSQNATFAGDVEIAANLFSTGQNLRFHAAGTHVMNIDVNGKVYPNVNNAYDLGHSASLAWRNLYLGGSIISSGGATFAGDVSMAKLTATKSGTAAVFNSGTTNVVATFTSTDGIASLQCVDSSGNVEFGASGNNFVVQPAGGVAQLSVGSSTSTFAGDITLTPGNSNKIILTPDVNSHYITGNAYWVDVVGNAAEVFRVFGGVGGTSEYFRITGTGAISVGNTGTNYGTSGEVLISNGNTSPTWGAATSVSEDNYYKIDDGLNFYLAFKEGSGTTVADVSGGRNNFTAGVGLDWSETGRFGYAQSFNGSNSYLNGTGPSSDITTFSAWVNNDGDGGIQNIVSGTYIMAYVSIYNNNFSIYDGVSWRNGGAVPANEWVHVAFSYDAAGTSGGLQKMYVNGVLGYSATAVGYTGVSSYISKVGIFTGAIRYFNGEITAIKTWDRILSDSEILAIYNQTALNENLTVLGKVGIGVTTPSTKFHVSNAAVINDAYGLALVENTSTGTGSAANSGLNVKSKYGTSQFMQWENQGLRIGSRILDNSSAGNVYFTAGGDSVKMVMLAGGEVGIGTTLPSAPLDVWGSGADGTALLRLTGSAGSTAFNWISSVVYPNLASGNTAIKLFGHSQGSNNQAYVGFKYAGSGSTNNTLTFGFYANNFLVNLLANGNFGIGTDSPDNKLQVVAGNAQVQAWFGETSYTNAAIRIGGDNFPGGRIFLQYDGDNSYIDSYGGHGSTQRYRDFTVGARNIRFVTGNTSGSEKMRVAESGNVGIDNTSPSSKLSIGGNAISTLKPTVVIADETNGASLTLRGQSPILYFDVTASGVPKILMDGSGIEFKQGTLDSQGAVSFKIDSSGNSTFAGDVVAYGSPSDIRLKKNIKPIESALDKVMKLQGVTFDWKKSDSILDIKEDIGFIAQDVQKVIPELVRENEDGMLSMRHQGIAPILLEAIKELKAEIEELKKHKCNCKE